MDVSLEYHVSESITSITGFNLKNTDVPAERVRERHFVRLHRKGFLALAGSLPPHLLSTLIVLGSYMAENRTSFTSSKHLGSLLGISRDAARDRLKALASISYNGVPLITISSSRRSVMAPLRYKVKFSSAVPLSSGGTHVTDEIWVKHFDEARELASQLSPEAHVTLLSLAVDMTETRTIRVPYRALAKRVGVTLTTAQSRIQELLKVGVITKLPSPNGNEYRIGDGVPLMFGAEEVPEEWGIELVEMSFSRIDENRWCTSSTPSFKKKKRIKDENTTQTVVVENSSVIKDQNQPIGTVRGEGKDSNNSQLNFASHVGGVLARQWVDQFGIDRCQEVWNRAKTARNPGGYMRKALTEHWVMPPSQEPIRKKQYWEITQAEREEVIERILGVSLNEPSPPVDKIKIFSDIKKMRLQLSR